MNIRKFIGVTSREAFRLVREALGPDAVVLSTRIREDCSVEIVACADGNLAKISPKTAAQHREMKLRASTGNQSPSQSASQSYSQSHSNANPYASGDVFSSVFGAHPEPLDDLQPEEQPDDTSRTMAESNPWLIEHARRVAQSAAEGAPQRALSASAAIAKGMGNPVSVTPQDPAEALGWTREAAQAAARRAEQKIAQLQTQTTPPAAQTASSMQEGAFAGLPASAPADVPEAIRVRRE